MIFTLRRATTSDLASLGHLLLQEKAKVRGPGEPVSQNGTENRQIKGFSSGREQRDAAAVTVCEMSCVVLFLCRISEMDGKAYSFCMLLGKKTGSGQRTKRLLLEEKLSPDRVTDVV